MLERSLFPYEVFQKGKALTNAYADGIEENTFFHDGYNESIYLALRSGYDKMVAKTEGLPGKPKEQYIGPYTGGLGSKIDFLRVRVLKRVYVKYNEVSYDCSRKGLYWDNTLIMSSESYVKGRRAEEKVTAIRKTKGYDATAKVRCTLCPLERGGLTIIPAG